MRPVWLATALALASTTGYAQQPFTLQQVLSAPYSLQLNAAPVGNRFAWIENAEGRRNIWTATPTEPARQLTHYTEDDAQDINNLAWSPDGQAVAYTYGAEDGADGHPANPAHLQRNTANRLLIQTLDNFQVDLGEGRSPLFSRDSKTLFFLRSGQIWQWPVSFVRVEGPCFGRPQPCNLPPDPPASSRTQQLVFDRGRASSLTLSPDGNLLAFISRRPTTDGPSHSFLALFNLTTHELTFPDASTGEDSAPTFSPDGKQLAWLRAPYTRQPEYTPHLTSPNPWSIELLDLATNTTRTAFTAEANKPGSVLPHTATGDPKLLWAVNNRILFYSEADGWTHLYALNAATGETRLLTPGKYEVEDAVLSPNRFSVYYTANEPLAYTSLPAATHTKQEDTLRSENTDRTHIYRNMLGDESGMNFTITKGDGSESHPAPSADGNFLVALIADAHTPMHVAQVTPQSKSTAFQGSAASNYPASSLITPQQILIPSTDNLTIHAQLFLPLHLDPTKKHATIIFVHGGPNRQMLLGYPGMDYYSNAYAMNQYLTSLGFIVLSVNYRGGVGYGLNFREAANYGPDGASEYNDVLAAQKYLVSRADVDPKRIGIWGGSYGGYLTALALARNSDLFAAGVDFHGVHEWSLEGDSDRWMTDPTHATAAQRDAAAALAHSSSPMADIDKWKSPVLLIHGDNDPEVNFAQTPLLADALRARHVPVEELVFPDEVHGFLLHKDWLAAYTAAAAFFMRVLKP